MSKREIRSIPDSDHVMRYIAPGRQMRDFETDALVGVFPQAFELRECDHGGLSVTWVEYFGAKSAACCAQASAQISKSFKKGKEPPVFAVANVGAIKAAGREDGCSIRVSHEPTSNNPAHAAIRRYSNDNKYLLSLLAKEVFVELLDAAGGSAK